MSSNKRKNKIQKKVEASILNAVTKFKSDDSLLNPYEKSINAEIESIIIGDHSAQMLWDQAKKGAPPPPFLAEPAKEPSETTSDHKQILTSEQPKEEGKEALSINPQNESNIPNNSPPQEDIDLQPRADNADLKTIALDFQANKNPLAHQAYHPTATNELLTKQTPYNLLQYKLFEGEHLKIAQKKIEELENNLEKLRIENERLATASELFQKRAEEATLSKQEIEKKLHFNEERFSEERETLKNHIEHRDQTIKELKDKAEHLDARLTADIRKSRSKERELENRLELIRLEKISLVGSKDDIILDLKRQVDQLNHELGNYRRKTAQMNQALEANQEQFRRTVRALRLALTNLEVNDPIGGQIKKAE